MKKFISNIKNKPEHVRRQVLYAVTAVCGLVLILVWVSGLKSQFAKKAEENEGTKSGFAPFTMLRDNFGKAVEEVSTGVKKIGQ